MKKKKSRRRHIYIRYEIITKSLCRQTISRYNLKTNVNQQKKTLLTKGRIQYFHIRIFLCLKLTK